MSTIYLSQKGFKELHKEIGRLENQEKALMMELREIGRAKTHDDSLRRSEITLNLEYLQSKLMEKREALKTARPLPRKRDRLKVALGSVVDLIDQQGRLMRYTLVNSIEADPSDGRLSIESPLGKSLLNRQPSETISLNARRFRLVRIS